MVILPETMWSQFSTVQSFDTMRSNSFLIQGGFVFARDDMDLVDDVGRTLKSLKSYLSRGVLAEKSRSKGGSIPDFWKRNRLIWQ